MFQPVYRPRRLRSNENIRRMVRETKLSPDDFIYPLFVTHGKGVKKEIGSMPGNFQQSIDNIVKDCEEVKELGIPAVLLFGIPEHKDEVGSEAYARSEVQLRDLLRRIDPTDQWYLMERLEWLTRREGEPYFGYIGRLLERAKKTPEVVRVKLADRLDNTLDTRIEIGDPMEGVDFFETVFKVMFLPGFRGYNPGCPHPARSPVSGAYRLYQLFKNSVLDMAPRSGSGEIFQIHATRMNRK